MLGWLLIIATAAEPGAEPLPPPRLRACCAFGYDLKTSVGGEVLPTVVPNVAAHDDLGHHAYLQPIETPERNGIVYTCRGGFIDVSHVRDYADVTRWLYGELRAVLGSGITLELPVEGATKTLRLKAAPMPADPAARDALALRLAARIAYDLSLDLIYDGRAGVFGLRPVELGVAWNLLGNGFSGDYLERRLIWSVNVLPELYAAPNAQSVADFVVNTRLYWHHSLLSSRLTLGADVQVSWGTLRRSVVGEVVARVTYNQLLSVGKGRHRLHTILSIGFEGGIDWWPTAARGIAPLNHRSIQLLAPVGTSEFYGVANLYFELSLPMLAI